LLLLFFFYLVAGGVVLNDWKRGEQREPEGGEVKERERERMNESDGGERGAIESPLYVHWADKQVAEYIMRMNEEEGTLSPRLSPPPSYTPPPFLVSLFQVKVK